MLKKIVSMIVIVVMMIILLTGDKKATFVNNNFTSRKPLKVDVLLINFTDDYISLVRKNLEDIQKENSEKVEFTFYDGKSNQVIQNEQINKILTEGTDLILLHLINNRDNVTVKTVIDQIKKTNTPVILFNREPITIDAIKSYQKALYIGLDAQNDGIMQGQILVDLWNTDRDFMDKNRDGVMQYVMLSGERDNIVASDRTKYSLLTLEQAEIKTNELAAVFAYWTRELAQNVMQSLFLRYGGSIEVVIANDDSMALGAIKALQSYGYNLGDKEKTIVVVGVEGLPEAQELIKKGMMAGTIFQDPKALAEALYTVGINLVQNENPLEGTPYKFDKTGASIRIPNQIIYKQ